jgi:hypothetical protein
MPVTSMPLRYCHLATAAFVIGPNSPSGVVRTTRWMVATAGPTDPSASRAHVDERLTVEPLAPTAAKDVNPSATTRPSDARRHRLLRSSTMPPFCPTLM